MLVYEMEDELSDFLLHQCDARSVNCLFALAPDDAVHYAGIREWVPEQARSEAQVIHVVLQSVTVAEEGRVGCYLLDGDWECRQSAAEDFHVETCEA
jgi:hypothetical protein